MTPRTASATTPAPHATTTRLSAEQQQVVDHGVGALLVFAGPGSGKTRTLTARIAALLAGRRARARQILALTFTVRAAEEMRVRLTAAIGSDAAGDVTVATFHALGARILRENATAFGRTPAYSIYDADDILGVIRAGLDEGEHADAPADDLAKEARVQITLAKSRLWSPTDLRERAEHPDCACIAAVWEHMESRAARIQRVRLRRSRHQERGVADARSGRSRSLPAPLAPHPRRRVPRHRSCAVRAARTPRRARRRCATGVAGRRRRRRSAAVSLARSRRSTTCSASGAPIRARRSSSCGATTAPDRRSSRSPRAASRTTRAGARRISSPTARRAAASGSHASPATVTRPPG